MIDFKNTDRASVKAKIDALRKDGVSIPLEDGIIISDGVKIGKGTVVLPGTVIVGETEIGENCTVGPNSYIENCKLGDNTLFKASYADSSEIGSSVRIGPFCNIRPDSVISDDVKIGDFVEVKNSKIGRKTSVAHLTYVGDSDVGERCNFGCGVVTVNYDGKNKHRTVIGDNVFIGCNVNLVAPVKVNDNAYIAAGSTITDEIPEYALAIARSRQTNKENWNKK